MAFVRVCFKRIIYFELMIVNFKVGQKNAKADLSNPIDISLITREETSFKAWYASEMKTNIIRGEGFVGSVD